MTLANKNTRAIQIVDAQIWNLPATMIDSPWRTRLDVSMLRKVPRRAPGNKGAAIPRFSQLNAINQASRVMQKLKFLKCKPSLTKIVIQLWKEFAAWPRCALSPVAFLASTGSMLRSFLLAAVPGSPDSSDSAAVRLL